MMKSLITTIVLLLCVDGYSQTSLKPQKSEPSNPDRYLWSFSKNKPAAGEKALIDFDVMDNRRGMGDYLAVSDDGSYFAYTINQMAFNTFAFGLFKVDSLVIQSTKNGQRTEFAGQRPGSFTADSRQYIFYDGGALCFLQLGGAQLEKINDVVSYKISQDKWLAYQLKGNEGLNLRNLITGKEKQFAGIADYNFSKNGEWLIYKNKDKELSLYNVATGAERKLSIVEEYSFLENEKGLLAKTADKDNTALQYINLSTGEAKTIWKKEKTGIGNYCIDAGGKQVAFAVTDSADATNTGIWYCATGMDKAVLKIGNQASVIPARLTIGDFSFTDNSRYMKLSLQAEPDVTNKTDDNLAGVEVWNHKDLDLQSAQAKQLNETRSYNSVFNIESGKLLFLESDDKKVVQMQGDYAIIKKDYKDVIGDRFWEQGKGRNQDSTWVIDLKDGNRRLLPTKSNRFWFSPFGSYLVYYDNTSGCHYFNYDLTSGVVKDISVNVPENQLGFINRENDQAPRQGNLAAWIEGGASVLVYDNYDIWKLDIAGKQSAVNITGGFGQAKSTILNLFTTARYSSEVPIVKSNETLLLRAYNLSNKQSGFYRKAVSVAGIPQLLYMGDYFMYAIDGCQDENVSKRGMAPLQAKGTNTWIVQRQSTNDAPNYYETSDFKSFKRLTNYQPQKNYQWLSEELHSFKHLDGKTGQGILYKPENFDPNKKYPVMIAFYGQFSNNMYQFPDPSYIDQSMETGKSPIWFLNNGFLVFTPDIVVAPGKFGPKAFSVIERAAQYLKTLPFVDGNKLGIASHSWGAKLAAYLFNHSTSIAATAITEGMWHGNMIGVAFSSDKSGVSKLDEVENGEYQFGSFWKNKESWLDQTTVLNVDKATSPLLLLCNKESSEDYQDQTFQFFNALRRLDKNVWWLKYDKGDHTLNDHKELQDYSIRYTQFFDHYLKNAPAPMWMTQGVPYKLKGIESRYELDPQGKCNVTNGEPCPICEAWNKQYARTPEMFKKEIKDWALDKDIADELERKQNKRRKELDKQGEIQTKEVLRMLNAN